jgi:diguanylate cyclase (GGDEF)-like protein/PAS domain S-box-containing protein
MSRVNEVFYWSQASPVFDDHGHVIAALEILRDKNSDAVIESKRNLRRITDNMSDLVSELDCHGNVVFASPSHYKVLGYTDQRMMTITLADLVHCEDLPQVTDALKKSLQTGRTGITHHRCRHRDGHYVWTETVGNPIWQDGKVSGIILSSRDITDRKQLEQELRYISTHDALTSLYNRTYFEEELIRLENGRFNPVGMIMFDLDGLKLVNDTMGHEAGDRLLKNFAQILQSCFRSSDIVSRVGGDEFAVLLPNSNNQVMDKIAGQVITSIQIYNQTNPALPLSVSMGKAIRKDKPFYFAGHVQGSRQSHVPNQTANQQQCSQCSGEYALKSTAGQGQSDRRSWGAHEHTGCSIGERIEALGKRADQSAITGTVS